MTEQYANYLMKKKYLHLGITVSMDIVSPLMGKKILEQILSFADTESISFYHNHFKQLRHFYICIGTTVNLSLEKNLGFCHLRKLGNVYYFLS